MSNAQRIAAALAILAMSSFACTTASPDPTPEVVVHESTRHEKAAGAREVGQWIITREGDEYAGRIGVFIGLEECLTVIKPDSEVWLEETLNLYLRQRDIGDESEWVTVQPLHVATGDYIAVSVGNGGVTSVLTVAH